MRWVQKSAGEKGLMQRKSLIDKSATTGRQPGGPEAFLIAELKKPAYPHHRHTDRLGISRRTGVCCGCSVKKVGLQAWISEAPPADPKSVGRFCLFLPASRSNQQHPKYCNKPCVLVSSSSCLFSFLYSFGERETGFYTYSRPLITYYCTAVPFRLALLILRVSDVRHR